MAFRTFPICYSQPFKICIRTMTAKTRIIEDMPTIQYVTESTKRTKRLYSWGIGSFGCLGKAGLVKENRKTGLAVEIGKPFRLKFAETHKVNDVACGNNFTVISATSPETTFCVFGTGMNTDSQIGYHERMKDRPLMLLSQPVPIQLPLIHHNTKVIRVACGRAHTIVLTDKEGVFSLGNNAFGQCGRPIIEGEIYEKCLRISKVKELPENIVDVVCGQDHTLFLTSTGEVYSCGWGADGQTGKAISGQGHYDNCGVPRQVKGDILGENIIQVSGAVDCALAVSDKGDLFGWGNSEYGQLTNIISEPQKNISHHIPAPHVGCVKQASAGGTACALVNDKGQVFVWGFGLLGKGPNVGHLPIPTLLPEPLFGRNEFQPDVVVKNVTCGLRHFAAINSKGDLYMWGKNKHCCLGLGHPEDQFFPFRVAISAEVQKVSLGVAHTFAIARGHI